MPPFQCVVLFAAGGLDWFEGLVPLLFVLFWIVSQVWGVFRNVSDGRSVPDGRSVEGRNLARRPDPAGRPEDHEPPRPVRPRPPADAGRRGPVRPEAPARQPRNEREAIARQIEEFLRDSTGAEQRQPPPVPPGPPKPPARDRRRRSAPEPARQTPLRETPSSFHEMPHLAEPLAAREAPTPSVSPPASPTATTPTAADLVAMFRDPSTLRQLILVREVLDRPVGHW